MLCPRPGSVQISINAILAAIAIVLAGLALLNFLGAAPSFSCFMRRHSALQIAKACRALSRGEPLCSVVELAQESRIHPALNESTKHRAVNSDSPLFVGNPELRWASARDGVEKVDIVYLA